jgi:hypothetical protein
MRTSTSVATALLAAGAGWLAAKMWQENAYGVRDRVRAGGYRMRLQSERMRMRGQRIGEEVRHRGEEAWERGRHMAEESLQQARGGGVIQRGREMLRRMRGGGDYAAEEDYGSYSGPYGEDFGEYDRGGYYRGSRTEPGERRAGKSPSRSAEVYRSQGYRSY